MAKQFAPSFVPRTRTKRTGVHSKNASINQTGYKKPYKGQGR